MKRVCIISHGAAGGGSERVATLIANYLANKYEVYFYAIHDAKREYFIDEKIKYEFCEVHGKTGAERMLKRTWMLRKYVKDNKINVIISFIYLEGLILSLNRRITKIYSLRNDPTRFCNKGIFKFARDFLYRTADKVVFQTPDAKAYFDEKIQKHGVIIPNPLSVDLPYWSKDAHNKEIIAVGRLSGQKNFAMLIKAFAIFSKTHPEYRLTICGEGEQKNDLIHFASQLNVVEKINFPGFITDVHERMTKAEIYVSTSIYEGISNSMLEALAIGIPTVCTDCPVGGARMFIQNGVNGNLVKINDVDALAKAFTQIADDKEKQLSYSTESVKIREELDINRICEQWEALID